MKSCIVVAMNAAPCMSGGAIMNTSWPPLAAAFSACSFSCCTRSRVKGSMPPARPKNRSSLRHMTPLGMPVVPPV
jgi:hypothetical protein